MARIFISYRHALSYHAAARLRELLTVRFGHSAVFLDEQAFQAGTSFPDRIKEGLSRCEVFLPLIDVGWAHLADGPAPRLHNPSDWVRQEIETILHRNTDRPAGTDEPVLIIPILLNGATMPDAAELPAEIAPICSRFGISFRSEKDIDTLVPIIEAFLGDPLVGNLGARLITSSPDLSRSKLYRFRAPITREQLAPFVDISDHEPDISLSNPNLKNDERLNLYDAWCQWTALDQSTPWSEPPNGTRSFLTLEHLSANGQWAPVAISVLLPLSEEGGRLLTGLTMDALSAPAAKRTAVTFEADHLQREGSSCLLIDTWAVGSTSGENGRNRRHNHHNWGVALLLRHVAEFWSPLTRTPVTIMAEPNERVGRVLATLGFERRPRNAASGDLYYVDYPLNAFRYGSEIQRTFEKSVGNLAKLSAQPIIRCH